MKIKSIFKITAISIIFLTNCAEVQAGGRLIEEHSANYDLKAKAEELLKNKKKDEAIKILSGMNLCTTIQSEYGYEEAINVCKKATEEGTIISRYFSDKCVIFRNIGNDDEALKACNKGIKEDIKNEEAYLNKGDILLNIPGKFEEAIDQYDKVIELLPKSSLGHLRKSGALVGEHRLADSLEVINKAIAKNDREEELIKLYYAKGWILISLIDFSSAIKEFDNVIKFRENADLALNIDRYEYIMTRAYCGKGYALSNIGNKMATINNYKEAIALNKNNRIDDYLLARAYIGLASAYTDLGKYQDALDIINDAIKIEGKYIEFYINKARALIKLKRYEEAIKTSDISLQLNGSSELVGMPQTNLIWVILGLKGRALVELDKSEEGVAVLDKGIALNIKAYELYAVKAYGFIKLKKAKEAKESIKEGIKHCPKELKEQMEKEWQWLIKD